MAVCGPLSLLVEVRKEVVWLSAHRVRPIYMPVEFLIS